MAFADINAELGARWSRLEETAKMARAAAAGRAERLSSLVQGNMVERCCSGMPRRGVKCMLRSP